MLEIFFFSCELLVTLPAKLFVYFFKVAREVDLKFICLFKTSYILSVSMTPSLHSIASFHKKKVQSLHCYSLKVLISLSMIGTLLLLKMENKNEIVFFFFFFAADWILCTWIKTALSDPETLANRWRQLLDNSMNIRFIFKLIKPAIILWWMDSNSVLLNKETQEKAN